MVNAFNRSGQRFRTRLRSIRFLIVLAALAVLILPVSCELFFNGRGGMPGYLNYVSDSVKLDQLNVPELDASSYVTLNFVRPDGPFQAALQAANPSLDTEVLVLTYSDTPLLPKRSLIFSPDLELLYDTWKLDPSGDRFKNWVLDSEAAAFRSYGAGGPALGSLDLGLGSFQLDPNGNAPSYRDNANLNPDARIASYNNFGSYRDYFIQYNLWQGPPDSLDLTVVGSIDDTGAYMNHGNIIPLLSDVSAAVTASFESFGPEWEDLVDPNRSYEMKLISFESDENNGRFLPIFAIVDNDRILSYMVFFMHYELLESYVPGYPEYIAIPARQFVRAENVSLLFDGEFLFTVDSADPDRDTWWQSADILVTRISGNGYQPNSNQSPVVSRVAEFSYASLFPDMLPKYDFDVTLADSQGQWYMFHRDTNKIFRLNIGEGGW